MIDPPMTKEEAQAYRYGCWDGDPKGRAYNRHHCAYSVFRAGERIARQCQRNKGYGPVALYCKVHAKKVQTCTGGE